jgi:dihydropteroate synthase
LRWKTSRFSIDLSQPRVMGIVNVTPDSFSDGGRFVHAGRAQAHCEQLLQAGADILDIGGESTRPGAEPISWQEELARIEPIVRHAVTLGIPVSVDTYKPQVMQAVLDWGVDIINDVWALRYPAEWAQGVEARAVVAKHPSCGVCLMHMHREPQTMQLTPMQGDVVPQVKYFFQSALHAIRAACVEPARICLDPGIGFGKTVQQNFALLARQTELLALGYPVLVGWSRKSSLASVCDLPAQAHEVADSMPHPRMVPSVAAAVLAVQNGAHIVRVHDVKETVQALRVIGAMRAAVEYNNPIN